MRKTAGIVWATLLVMATQGYGLDWPMYLWDVTHTSFNLAESVLTPATVARLHAKWLINLGNTISSGITIVNGVAYVGDWNGNFSAINVTDGVLHWQTFVGRSPPSPNCALSNIGVSSQAVVQNGVVYVGGGDAAVYALDAASGAILWRLPLGDATAGAYLWSSIILYHNALYIGLASLGDCPLVQGELARIDLTNPAASVVYLEPPGRLGAGVWSTPAIDPGSNTVLVTTGNGDEDLASGAYGEAMLKLNADTLAIRASFFLPTDYAALDLDWGSSATLVPIPDGPTLVLATAKDGVLYAQELRGLSPVWQTSLAISAASAAPLEGGSLSSPAFDGQRVYVGAGIPPDRSSLGALYALEPMTGRVLWRQLLAGAMIAPPTVAAGVVYAPTLTGLQVFDAATGTLLWQDPTGTPQFGQVAVVDGVVYAGYSDGSVRAWTAP